MENVRLTPPGEKRQRGERARLYIRWLPHLGPEAVALYELLRILPDVGQEVIEVPELADMLRTTPENVEEIFERLSEAGFIVERDGWLDVAEHPPANRKSRTKAAEEERVAPTPGRVADALPDSKLEVVRAEAEDVTPDDYFNYMGSLPPPHILEFLNGYCKRDAMSPAVVREALKIASERDARRVGYVRSILERWVERGVKTVEDVELFEKDRKLRLVEHGGAMKIGEGVSGGADRQSAARSREDYRWFFGE